MTTVIEIEKAIKNLARDEYSELRGWIENYDLEKDVTRSSAEIMAMLDAEDGGESQLTSE